MRLRPRLLSPTLKDLRALNLFVSRLRESMLGPISSPPWKANTKSGHPGRERTRWEPETLFVVHPILASAPRRRVAFTEGHTLSRGIGL
jgi:hypothetical protein